MLYIKPDKIDVIRQKQYKCLKALAPVFRSAYNDITCMLHKKFNHNTKRFTYHLWTRSNRFSKGETFQNNKYRKELDEFIKEWGLKYDIINIKELNPADMCCLISIPNNELDSLEALLLMKGYLNGKEMF